jgi:hypothetical protein
MFWVYRCTQHNLQISAAGRAVAGLANGCTVAPSTTRVIHRLWRSAAGLTPPPITDDTGKPAGQATWDYLPDAVRTAVADVKNVLMSGSFADAKIVKIENLQVVIVNAEPGAIVNVNSGVEAVQKTARSCNRCHSGTYSPRRGCARNREKLLAIFR